MHERVKNPKGVGYLTLFEIHIFALNFHAIALLFFIEPFCGFFDVWKNNYGHDWRINEAQTAQDVALNVN